MKNEDDLNKNRKMKTTSTNFYNDLKRPQILFILNEDNLKKIFLKMKTTSIKSTLIGCDIIVN
jgi:hypothetical protein